MKRCCTLSLLGVLWSSLSLCAQTLAPIVQDPDFAADGRGSVTPVPPSEREVGIAYTTWVDESLWQGKTWDTPMLGKYDIRDRRIIRKHAEWIADAGVDFIWIDWSNNVTYNPDTLWVGGRQDVIEDATNLIFDEYDKLDRAGHPHPRISIFLGVTGAPESASDGRLQKKADQIYKDYISNPRYARLIQYYLGKPLLVVYTDTPSPWHTGTPNWKDDRFTVRWMTGFISEQRTLRSEDRVSRYGYWSWEDRGEQTYPIYKGTPESMVVCAATRAQGQPDSIPAQGREGGKTFKKQFARARQIGTHFAMIVSWNEWTTGEQPSLEVSKDIEPSATLKDQYLRLMKEEIHRFKTE
ncbi:MAG: hypothetical protein PHV49_05010 [Alistipes sp.]|nr:hypothetical protein [Alistipes sp.]